MTNLARVVVAVAVLETLVVGELAYGQNPTDLAQIRALAERGVSGAQVGMGVLYEEGLIVRQDDTESARWYRLAAEQGNRVGQYNLASCYAVGRGVEQNDRAAVRWFRRSANQGFGPAMYNLANFFMRGQMGLREDPVQVHMWANLAITRLEGEMRENAIKIRVAATVFMEPAQIAEAQRLAREWDAAHPR